MAHRARSRRCKAAHLLSLFLGGSWLLKANLTILEVVSACVVSTFSGLGIIGAVSADVLRYSASVVDDMLSTTTAEVETKKEQKKKPSSVYVCVIGRGVWANEFTVESYLHFSPPKSRTGTTSVVNDILCLPNRSALAEGVLLLVSLLH